MYSKKSISKVNYLFISFLLPLFIQAQEITYRDIEPILRKNCVSCHHKNSVAPFPLTSYQEVVAKAKLVKTVTTSRYMPPWLADPKFRHYANERVLTDAEIEVISNWVTQGKKEGTPLPPRQHSYAGGSQMDRKPDQILRMNQPAHITGNNEDTYMFIKYPVTFSEAKNIEAIEFIPGNRELVHHMNFNIFPMPPEICIFKGAYFANPDAPGKIPYQQMHMLLSDGYLPQSLYYGGWVPGMSPQIFKGDFGVQLTSESVLLVNTMHYAPSPTDTSDDSYFYIYYKKEPATRPLKFLNLGSASRVYSLIEPPLEIPPGQVKTFSIHTTLQEKISILYVVAHMHLIGKKFLAYAQLPSGKVEPILRINDWDFNWQEYCQLSPLLVLPAGTAIHIEGTYDNTKNNPNNPFSPPRTIHSTESMGTKDEMLNLMMIYVPYQEGDEKL